MKPEILLRDTFEAHEDLAPDAGNVLSAVHDRVHGRRRGVARPLAIAASVAVVAGAAGIAVLVADGSTHQSKQPAAGSPPAVLTHVAQPRTAGIAPLTMPFDLGWLPDGSVHYFARRINIGGVSDTSAPVFDGEYLMEITSSDRVIDLDVQRMPGGLHDVTFKSGPGEQTTIAGRPGVQSSNSAGPGGYEVYFRDADGGLMYVNAGPTAGDTVPAADLVSTGRQVAENVQFPGTTQVDPTFGIGDLPNRLAVRAFDVGQGGMSVPTSDGGAGTEGPRTSYSLGTADDPMQVSVWQGTLPGSAGAPDGRSVQGHATTLLDEDGYRTLSVEDAVDGDSVELAGRVSFDELYAIADGLVLP